MDTDSKKDNLMQSEQQNPVPKPPQKTTSQKFSSYKRFLLPTLILACGLLLFMFLSPILHTNRAVKIGESTGLIKSAKAVNYFSVVSVSPQNNSSDNAQDSPIKITFSEPVRPDSLKSFFTVSPMIPGTFTQGATPNEIIFKAKYTFGEGTSVKVILNKGFESIGGNKFTTDYTYNFYTSIFDNSVVFENNSIYSRWVNLPVGQDITFKLHVGNAVSPDATITTYKGTFDKIVSSLLYTNETHKDSSYVTQTYIDYPVDTTNMAKVSEVKKIQNDASFDFNQGEGLYYVEAKSNGKPVGSTWISVTDQGLIVRQDDQKITLGVQNVKTGDINTKVKVFLYSLQDKPTLLLVSDLQNYGEFPIEYPQKVDLVVGQTDKGVILVPLTVPQTQADIRVTSNLTNLDRIYLQTDRPTYMTSDTVKFSGILRQDNDAKYSTPSADTTVDVWIQDPNDSTKKLVDQTVSVGNGGIFSGQFDIPQSLTPSTQNPTLSTTLYAKEVRDNSLYITSKSYTTFDIVSQNSKAIIKVNFDKSNYTRDETVTAHITAFDTTGNPMSNKSITYTVYAKGYYENDPTSVANFGNEWGEKTKVIDQSVTLNANGQADVKFDQLDGTTSQAITLEATTVLDDGTQIYGAKTVLVQQGKIVLFFGPSRQEYHTGDTTISRVYAKDLSGNPSANVDLHYQVYTSQYDNASKGYKEKIINDGTAKTDSNGFALIQQAVTTDMTYVTMRVMTKDSAGNNIQTEKSMNILAKDVQSSAIYYHDLTLSNLDVATDKLSYNVGDTAALVINSPFDQNVLVTYESGRIYHDEWLKLNKGDNNYRVNITQELFPSFTIVFSYFNNTSLFIEGVPFTVTDISKNLNITATTDKNTYTKSDQAQLTITTKDSTGQPTNAHVMVSVIDDSIFNLRNNLPSGTIYWDFYRPRMVTTNFSASTLGIGTGGGCGGGSGTDITYVPNRIGNNYYWNPNVTTDQNGNANITIPLANANGKLRVLITASTDSTSLGQTQSSFLVQ